MSCHDDSLKNERQHQYAAAVGSLFFENGKPTIHRIFGEPRPPYERQETYDSTSGRPTTGKRNDALLT